MYRIHIDIPAGHDKEKASAIVAEVISRLSASGGVSVGVKANYRLGHDEDRQKSNHLDVNENGHISCKKFVVELP